MALPSEWIDRLFVRLELAYGHRFLSQWPGIAPAVIKADWAEKLDGFEQHREAMQFALDNLPPDQPINAMQFRDLARRAPAKPAPALPAPPVSREGLARLQASLAKSFANPVDRLTPIRTLMAREMAGDKRLTKAQREFWRTCLRSELLAKTGIDTALSFDLRELSDALHTPAARARFAA